MSAPQIILELIERFERNIEAYKSGVLRGARPTGSYIVIEEGQG